MEAVQRGRRTLPLQSRAGFGAPLADVAALIAGRRAVCVAGSHGKSTTTAMLLHILTAAGHGDFGYMLGADFPDPDQPPARLGAADAPFVTEACEAHGALDVWRPWRAILTGLDDEHADHYAGTEGLHRAFAAFLARVPAEGGLLVCGDDPASADLLPRARCPVLTYGLDPGNGLRGIRTGPQCEKKS